MNDVAAKKPYGYAVVDGDVRRDRDVVIGICRSNMSTSARFLHKYDWFYGSCPWGKPLLLLLRCEASGETVGTAAIGPRRMLLNGRKIRAGVLVDLVVDARHRTLGPALMLQRAALERALERFDFIYGFPNPKALPVVKRAGYIGLGDMVRLTHVLHYAPYLRPLMPHALALAAGWLIDGLDRCRNLIRRVFGSRLHGEWRDNADERMQTLWDRSSPRAGLVGVRDVETSRWRFDEAAFNRVRYLLVSARDGDALTAWFACQSEGTTLHIRDFWSVDAQTGISRAALDALVRAASAAGYVSISFECLGDDHAIGAWRAARFMERSRRPVVGAWAPALSDELCAAKIHLTPADEDE
jgi:GNAT superfamily N-acetyltransferase